MKYIVWMICGLLLLPVLCMAAGTARDSVDLTLQSAPPPVEKPSPAPITSFRQRYEKFLERDRDSKVCGIVISVIEATLSLVVFIIFLTIRKPRDGIIRVARNTAVLLLVFPAALMVIHPESFHGYRPLTVAILDLLMFLKIMSCIYVGYRMCRLLGIDYWGISMWKKDREHVLAVTAGAILLGVVCSRSLILATHPSSGWASAAFNKMTYSSFLQRLAVFLLIGVEAAFKEEFIYRGCLQPLFTKGLGGTRAAAWMAIVMSAGIWTFGHTGSLSPDWVKYAQIFPMGLFLGWWSRRAGITGTLLFHAGFNVVMTFVSVPLAHH